MVRPAYDSDAVRAAEAPLLAALPDGALMARAATGLAPGLRAACSTACTGRASCCSSAPGTTAGTRCTPVPRWPGEARGSRRCCSRTGSHEAALAAFLAGRRPAYRRIGRGRARRPGGRRDPRHRWPRRAARTGGRGRRADRRGPAGGRGRRAQRGRRLDRRGGRCRRPGRRHRDLRRAEDRAPGRPGRRARRASSSSSTSASDLPPADVEVLQADDVAELLPRADRESDKYRRGVARCGRRLRAVHRRRRAVHGCAPCTAGRAWSATVGADEPAALVRARWPEVVVGRRPGAGVGGRVGRRRRTRPQRLEHAVAAGVPLVVDADALAALADLDDRRRSRSLLTPHAGELARLVGADRADVEARRLHHARGCGPRPAAPSCCSRARRRVVARPDGRVRVNPTGTPALGDRRFRRRPRRPLRRAAGRRAGPVRRGVGRCLAARAGRPARRRRRCARSPRRTSSPRCRRPSACPVTGTDTGWRLGVSTAR